VASLKLCERRAPYRNVRHENYCSCEIKKEKKLNEQTKLLIEQVILAFQRIRALLFTMTLLCAFLFANAYIERYSLDEQQIYYSTALKTQLKNDFEKETDLIKKSKLEARMQRIDNNLKDFKLRTVTLPAIGLTIPANDVNIIGGIFLMALSAWILFSTEQIRDALSEPDLEVEIKAVIPALRHAAVFVYKPSQRFLKSTSANIMFVLPPLTLIIVTAEDFFSIVDFDKQSHLANMFTELLARLMILTGILGFLSYVSFKLIESRKVLTEFFYPSSL